MATRAGRFRDVLAFGNIGGIGIQDFQLGPGFHTDLRLSGCRSKTSSRKTCNEDRQDWEPKTAV
jgi:hypothetical protein